MESLVALYQNAKRVLFEEANTPLEAVSKAKEYYSKQGKDINLYI